jgi:hypothetical protein
MSSVWIGFLGVLVGGLITTLWSWLAVVRQELSDAMVSARLVDENLANLERESDTSSSARHPRISTDVWELNRGALARVLGRQQWEAVSAVYRHPHTQPQQEDTLDNRIGQARLALRQLVDGKRYVIPQRWRNMFSRRRTRRRTTRDTLAP